MKNLETEYKWSGEKPRAFNCMLAAIKKELLPQHISAKKQLQITDVYLDHPDKQFDNQQLAFRVRHYGKVWEATFKTRTQLVNGKAVRREETQKLFGVQSLKQALAYLEAQKKWKNLIVSGLQPLFIIRNKRIVRMLSSKKFQAELAFDTCTICVGKKRVKFKEIELELKQGQPRQFDELVARLSAASRLAPSTKSKVKTAVCLLQQGETK